MSIAKRKCTSLNMATSNEITNGEIQPKNTVLWTHPNPDSSRMVGFMHQIGRKYNVSLTTYNELYRWSIENIAEFWAEAWHFTGVVAQKGFDEVGSQSAT